MPICSAPNACSDSCSVLALGEVRGVSVKIILRNRGRIVETRDATWDWELLNYWVLMMHMHTKPLICSKLVFWFFCGMAFPVSYHILGSVLDPIPDHGHIPPTPTPTTTVHVL